MQFRHLEYPPGIPVSELGPAALDDLLERGDLEEWRPIAAAVRGDPHGPLAETILRLCKAHPMYGTSTIWRTWIEALRRESRSLTLRDLRRERGQTQNEVGRRMGMSQSDVSKLERRGDLRVSTMRSYVAATGGRLEIWAEYDERDGKVRFRLG